MGHAVGYMEGGVWGRAGSGIIVSMLVGERLCRKANAGKTLSMGFAEDVLSCRAGLVRLLPCDWT